MHPESESEQPQAGTALSSSLTFPTPPGRSLGLERQLRRSVIALGTVAVALMASLSLMAWRNARKAAEDSDWVAHTQEVRFGLEYALRDLVDAHSGVRGFALTANSYFLSPYEGAEGKFRGDLQRLRNLTADNPRQQRSMVGLSAQAEAVLADAREIVLARKRGAAPSAALLVQSKQDMDAVRGSIRQMENEESRLLLEREQRSRSQRNTTATVMILGSLLGIAFVSIAIFAVRYELGGMVQARQQVDRLNRDLDRRVEERTAELGESEGRLEGVIQSAMDAIITLDDQQRIVLFNAAAESMFRCSAAEATGRSIDQFIPQRFRPAHAEHVRRFAATGTTSRRMGGAGILWGLRADGGEFPMEASISQTIARGEKLFTVIMRDITERREAVASRLRLAAIVDSTDSAVLSKDLSGTVTSWNRAAERLFGYSEAEMLGQHVNRIIPPQLWDEEKQSLRQIAQGAQVRREETVRRRKDGSLVQVSLILSPVRDASGEVVGASSIAYDITRRKQAEEALRASHDRLKRVLEVETVGVMFWDLTTGHLIDANDTFLKLMGYGRGDIEARALTWQKLTPPEFHELSLAELRKFAATGRVGPYEKEYLHKDGTRQWFVFAGSSLGDNTCVEFCVDISGRKAAEAALRESQKDFQALANGIQQLAWMAEPDGHITWYNQRWYEYTGTTFEQMQGWGWQSVHDPEVLPRVRERWKDSLASGQPLDMEFPLRGADGRFRIFLTRVLPLKSAEGQVLRWFGTNTDISELKAAEQRLAAQAQELSRQAEELQRSERALVEQGRTLQSVLDNISDGLVAADTQGKFVLWNPAAEKILGKPKEEVPPEEWSRHYGLYLPDRTTLFPLEKLPLARAMRGQHCSAEIFMRRGDSGQEVWLDVTGSPLRDAEGEVCGAVVAFRDVTHRVQALQEIRRLNTSLERGVRERTAQLEAANQELESFTYSVSHDLRAPLRQISGFVTILAEDFGAGLAPEAQRYLGLISTGAQNMGQLITEMLNLSRLERQSLQRTRVSLNSLVEQTVALLRPETEGRQVQWKIAALSACDCDPVLTRQIFQNLISNALKYSRKKEVAVIEIGQVEHENGAAIFVRDNGAGFEMKYADKLFGTFQRLHKKEDFEGLGIGLATVARIVRKHGGKVWAEAAPERGATFYFTLQASAAGESAARANRATAG